MSRTVVTLLAALILLPAAAFQDPPADDKEAKKQEQQKADDEAKAALKAYQDKRKHPKSMDDVIEAIDILKKAKPHKLIRAELLSILGSKLPPLVRIEAVAAFAEYKKDTTVCEALQRHAREERGKDKDILDLRKKCIRTFGDIAPYGKSKDMYILFSDLDTTIAREAIDAVESIKSVRMLQPLLALLAELERIREDEGGERGPGVPDGGAGGPNQGDNNSKKKRKDDLQNPTLKAINTIWGKVDSKKTFKNYTEAVKGVGEKKAEIKKILDEEDAKDAKEAKS
jgi:hypothetical protein